MKLGTGIPNVQRAIKVYFVFLFAFSGMEFTLTFLALERLNYSPRDMTMIFVFIGLVLAFTQGYFVRKYSSKIGERNFVIIGLLSGFLGLVFLSVAMTTTFFYVGLALLGIGIGCSSPSLTALVSLYSSNKEQGKQLGAFRSAGSLARAFGPLTAALVFWSFGSQVAYVTGAIIVLFSVLLSIFLPKPGAQA